MEIYKDVIGYEGIYQVSNLGNIKSLKFNKERLLNPCKDLDGYYKINLLINGLSKSRLVHQLVAESFLNHTRCKYKFVVDHINDNPTDNRLENLQVITHRENAYKTQGKYTSKYKGVHWHKASNKWTSSISINGKVKYLGLFINEEEASEIYQNKIKEILG